MTTGRQTTRFLPPLLLALILLQTPGYGQWDKFQAPQYLAEEIGRLANECYYFIEYFPFKQKDNVYALALFLNREALELRKGNVQALHGRSHSPCGPRQQQLRLYVLANDTTAVFMDSVFIDKYSVSINAISDFDHNGTANVVVNSNCAPPPRTLPPLSCYAFSMYEVTSKGKLRNSIPLRAVPVHAPGGLATGKPLDPVVMENIDKTDFPELLTVEDFFEGDPAFAPDDIPKVTLIYVWDDTAKIFRHRSFQYPGRFTLLDPVNISDNISLVNFVSGVLSLAAVGRMGDARRALASGLTPAHIAFWQSKYPQRARFIDAGRLRKKIETCIKRYPHG